MSFNNSQQKAISHKDGPMLVLAGPGSGKTTVITQRTKKLITEYHVDSANILVITFTKAAAMEMKQRFEKLMDGKTNVTFGTFHAVYFMVLKYAYHFQAANVISEEKKYQVMKEILVRYQLEYEDEREFIHNLFAEISMIKNTRIAVENYYSTQCAEEIFRQIFRDYTKRLHKNKWIDFDDMLLYTYELFEKRKDILSAWQKKYQYILVDEFQDINQIQYDILRMLALPENNLFIVGDDDQSIYRFRGSKPEIMLHFQDDYKKAKQILLDTNYRCQQNIVKVSLNLIGHNKNRYAKEIKATKQDEIPVKILKFENQKKENLYVIQEIQNGIREEREYQDYAILFRTNTQPRLLMEQLMEYNIPFKIKENVPSLYEHWLAKDILTYIRIAQGSRERKDFLQIMNRPKRYLSRDSIGNGTVSFERWRRNYADQPWIAERIERMEYDIGMLKDMSPYAAVNYLRKGIGYDDFVKEYAQYRHLNEEELFEVLDELQNSAKGYKSYDAWHRHMEDYAVQMKKMAEERNSNPNAVSLATLHGAKGLEFHSVYIVDVNEGIIPYKKAVRESEIEEERRMFYVGMTRAKENLTICSSNIVNNKDMEVSRFIRECQNAAASN